MTEQHPVILNDQTTVNQNGRQVGKEIVIKEDYAEHLIDDFKKHLNAENVDFILPDKVEIQGKKKR